MVPIDMVFNRQLVYGPGKLAVLPDMLAWYRVKRAFLSVFDAENPHVKSLVSGLRERGISPVVYSGFHGEPDLACVNEGRDIYVSEGCDCAIAFGGGSVIDATKAINMLAVNGGLVEEYQMDGRAVTTPPPLFVAIPTTSGTGAEATKVSVVTNNYNGLKKSLYHTTMIADIVILDPEVTTELPAPITAATGMDALSHAIESYVSLNATPITEMYGLAAIRLIRDNLATAVREPRNLDARGAMMLASYFGGVAITAGIGIAHIMAQPLGAIYKIPHGDACSIFLPVSIELNHSYAEKKYVDIADAFGLDIAASGSDGTIDALIRKIRDLQTAINAPVTLDSYISNELPTDEMIKVVNRTTGHITCNPRPLDRNLIVEAYAMVRGGN